MTRMSSGDTGMLGAPDDFSLLHRLDGHTSIVYETAWSPDGQVLASVGADRAVCFWDGRTGELLQKAKGHNDYVFSVAWSPDGRFLASASFDQTIRLADGLSGRTIRKLTGHRGPVFNVAWSPDGRILASGGFDETIRLWHRQNRWLHRTLEGHEHWVLSVTWSPDGRFLASGSRDQTIRLWDVRSGKLAQTITGHTHIVNCVAWSPDGRILASASDGQNIRLWDADSGRQLEVLEGHTGNVLSVRFSPDGRILASKSSDNTVRLWRSDTWETVSVLQEPVKSDLCYGLAFHPQAPVLATLGSEQRTIRVWQLDTDSILDVQEEAAEKAYRNAKVLVLGDTGVGKSGLALALTKKQWAPTPTLREHQIHRLTREEAVTKDGNHEVREAFLWDLAGRPGYRLSHLLHLEETAVVLLVFDARSEVDPFAGLRYWNRAIQNSLAAQGETAVPLKKYLVAARADRGGVPVSNARIEEIIRELGFDGYFETSASEDWRVKEVESAIIKGIEWNALPRIPSYKLFQMVQQFIEHKQDAGRIMIDGDELYNSFCSAHPRAMVERERADFEACVDRVETMGMVRRIGKEGYVLVRPSLLDVYASAIVNAAKSEPDGMGFIAEEDVLAVNLPLPEKEKVTGPLFERELIRAAIDELLTADIALRETSEYGVDLVFPAQYPRVRPDMPGRTEKFTFRGPARQICATLAARLSHNDLFERKAMWRTTVTFQAVEGGVCSFSLNELDEDLAELTLYFEEAVDEVTRYQFGYIVANHLEARALEGSVQRHREVACQMCGEEIPTAFVRRRRERGYATMNCPICDSTIPLLDRDEYLKVATGPLDPNRVVEQGRQGREIVTAILQERQRPSEFDVFLCHHPADKAAADWVRDRLMEQEIQVWYPSPDMPWIDSLSQDIDRVQNVVAFVGRGPTPWPDQETADLLRKFSNRRNGRLILVFLPSTRDIPTFPDNVYWVDLRRQEPETIDRLIDLLKKRATGILTDSGRSDNRRSPFSRIRTLRFRSEMSARARMLPS